MGARNDEFQFMIDYIIDHIDWPETVGLKCQSGSSATLSIDRSRGREKGKAILDLNDGSLSSVARRSTRPSVEAVDNT